MDGLSARVAADLRAAADVLERDGWTQGDYGRPSGCKCLYGGIHFAVTDGESVSDVELSREEEKRADAAASRVMEVVDAGGWLDLLDWNDEPGRTAAEVVAALRAAADRAEAES